MGDPKTMAHLKYMSHQNEGGWTLAQVRERYEKWREGQKKQTDLNFIIHVKKSGEIGGSCGFKHIDLLHKKAEYGIILHHPFWNTGIALECAHLCMDFAFSHLKLHHITFETLMTNKRAQVLLETLSVKLESIQKEAFFENGRFEDNAVYVLFENEWPEAKDRLQKSRLDPSP